MSNQNNNKVLAVIDANSLIHRAFHALPPLTSPQGELVGAVYGFVSILFGVIENLKPDYLLVAWDTKGPTFRHEEFDDYKGTRKETPSELIEQFDRVKGILEAFNVPQYAIEGYEADDLVGTIAELAKKNNDVDSYVVTGDMDALQLVDEHTKVYTTKKGFSNEVIYDASEVIKKYDGLRPDQVIDYKALRGDASDNIPGVRGVGEKTAIELLNKYQTLDDVYQHLDELKPRTRKLLEEGKESAYMSQKLATIDVQVPIEINLETARIGNFEHKAVVDILKKYGFKSLLARIPESDHKESQTALFEDQDNVAPDESFDEESFDPQLAAHIIDGLSGKELELDNLAFFYLGETVDVVTLSEEERHVLNAKLATVLKKKLELPENEKRKFLFYDVEMPLKPVLAEMQEYGVLIDTKLLAELSAKYAKEINQQILDIYADVGHEFNVNSPKQLEVILFDELSLPVIKKTKTQRSTNEAVLRTLSGMHPVIDKILTYRETFKIKSTYLDPLPEILDENNRVHTTFNQTKVASGRLSSENPNLQNIPTDPKYQLRELFIAPEGSKIVAADYSLIELRITAHITEDEDLIDAFSQKQDIHRATAAKIFDKEFSEITSEERKVGKTINFALMYGMTAHGLSESLGIDLSSADKYIKTFFERYPNVAAWKERFLAEAKENGYVETLFGRRRQLPELSAGNYHQRLAAERMAINHPMQGTQADIIKMAMVSIQNRLKNEKYAEQCHLILQIHDELVFEVKEEILEKIKEIIVEEMEQVIKLRVPVMVDIGVGENWQSAK